MLKIVQPTSYLLFLRLKRAKGKTEESSEKRNNKPIKIERQTTKGSQIYLLDLHKLVIIQVYFLIRKAKHGMIFFQYFNLFFPKITMEVYIYILLCLKMRPESTIQYQISLLLPWPLTHGCVSDLGTLMVLSTEGKVSE